MKIDPWLNDPDYEITPEDMERISIEGEELDALAMK